MPNPIKGEGVNVKIDGVEYPLIFTFQAIAEVETKYNDTIAQVQSKMPLVGVTVDLLKAGLVGFKGDLMNCDAPPLVDLQVTIQQALHIAYYGKIISDDDEVEEDPKGKP